MAGKRNQKIIIVPLHALRKAETGPLQALPAGDLSLLSFLSCSWSDKRSFPAFSGREILIPFLPFSCSNGQWLPMQKRQCPFRRRNQCCP